MRKKQYIVVEHVPIVFLEVVGLANSGVEESIYCGRTCTYGVLGGSGTGKLRDGRTVIEYILVENIPMVFLEVVGLANSGVEESS